MDQVEQAKGARLKVVLPVEDPSLSLPGKAVVVGHRFGVLDGHKVIIVDVILPYPDPKRGDGSPMN